MKNHQNRFLIISLLAFALACPSGVKAKWPENELRVLCIGNSLTYSNDLPAIVEAMAEASNQKRLVYKTIAFPNFGLQDQWERADAQKAIAGGKWDVVVLQQGPSALEESRKLLIEY